MKAAWNGKISVTDLNNRAQAYFIYPDKIDANPSLHRNEC